MKTLFVLAFIGGCFVCLKSPAMDLKEAKFTQVVNKVDVFSTAQKNSRPVAVNDIFKIPDALRTGPDSRAELVAADKTITRVGANTIFSYDVQNRTIDLQQGSLLFHSEHGKGGGTIRTSTAAAAVLGTTIIVTCTPDGGFKVLDMEGEVEITFKGGMRQRLEPGQMTFVLPGGKQRAPIIIFRLDSEVKDSKLVNGFTTQLDSMPRIKAEVLQQLQAILNNRIADTGLLVGSSATASSVQVIDPGTVQITHRVLTAENTVLKSFSPISINDSLIVAGGGNDVDVQSPSGVDVSGTVADSTSGDVSFISGAAGVNLNNGAIVAMQDAIIYGFSDVTINNYRISAGGNVNIQSAIGQVNVQNTSILAGTADASGAINISALNGMINMNNVHNVIAPGNIAIANSALLGGDVTINNSTYFAGAQASILSQSGDVTVQNSTVNSGGPTIVASGGGIVDVENSHLASGGAMTLSGQAGVTVNGASLTTDSSSGAVTMNSANSINVSHSSIQTGVLTLNSGDGILLDGNGATFTGSGASSAVNLTAVNTVTVNNADFTSYRTVSIAGNTINLSNVAFGNGPVNLTSLLGIANFIGILPGGINFIGNDTFNGKTIIPNLLIPLPGQVNLGNTLITLNHF